MGARRVIPPPKAQPAIIPAPIGGLNTVSPGMLMPELDAVLLWNMVSAENGLRSRLGSREYVTGLTGAADNLVRTMLSFKGSTTSGSKDRVFAVTSSGIWDVTSSGGVVTGAWAALTAYTVGQIVTNGGDTYICKTAGTSAGAGGPSGTDQSITDGNVVWRYMASNTAPTLKVSFGTTTGNAGRGVSHAVVTAAGHFLLYCDEVNGYHVYTESTDTWAAVAMGGGASQVANVDPATFRFVAVHKNKILFAAADSQSAYYLTATGDAIYGAATAFPLNLQFKNGGHLVGIYNWTYDGGSGVDDALVFVSSGGDVAIYLGTNLTSANTIALKGVWTVPGLPAGREIASAYGGDLVLLTKSGLLPLSRLVAGASTQESETYATAKVANLFNQLMLSKSTLPGWSIRLNPEDNTLLVNVPTYDSQAMEHLALGVGAKSWSRYDGLSIYSSVVHAGKLYYGTTDGKVGIHDGYIDGVTLADPNTYSAIQWRCITAFRNLGDPGYKKVEMIRLRIQSETAQPGIKTEAKYDFDLTELATVVPAVPGSGEWDVAEWDEAIWGDGYNPFGPVLGAVGLGVNVAMAIRGAATSRTILNGFEVMWTPSKGGFL